MANERTIERCKNQTELAMEQLVEVSYQLERAGEIRKAKSLRTIIFKLEEWKEKQ